MYSRGVVVLTRKSFGKAVEDGVVRYTSPSALTTADPTTQGCFRKWWYKYVMGLKEPSSASQELGTKTHAEIERYLLTGEQSMGAIAMSALHLIPDPNPLLKIEHNITPESGFTVAGIPLVGFIDLIDPTGIYIDPMGQRHLGQVNHEIVDWKTSSNLRYAVPSAKLIDTHQMALYAGWYLHENTAHRAVRISHVYMQTRGAKKSQKSTMIALRPEVDRRMLQIANVGNTLKQIACETDEQKVEPNLHACHNYGGCAFMPHCPKSAAQAAAYIFGTKEQNKEKDEQMKPEVKLEIENLLAAEKALEPPPEFMAALNFIAEVGYGAPNLTGEAAKTLSRVKREALPPSGQYPGEGTAGGTSVDSLEMLMEIARVVGVRVGKGFTIPAAVLPSDAPASQPHLAADPVEGFNVTTPAAILLDSAGGVTDLPATTVEVKPPAPAQHQRDETMSFNKLKKPQLIAECERLYALTQNAPVVTEVEAPSAVRIYVDCIAPGANDLAPIVQSACQNICEAFGAVDLRCAPKDSPLGFGAWKGVLAAYMRDYPLEPGDYYLDTRGSEIFEVAASALNITARGIR